MASRNQRGCGFMAVIDQMEELMRTWRKTILAPAVLELQLYSSRRIETGMRRREPSGRAVIARIVLSIAAMIAIGAVMASQCIAYAQAPVESDARPAISNTPNVTRTPQQLAFRAWLVGDITGFAYDLPLDRVERRPQWMYNDRYDVTLTTAAPASLPEQKQMLQKLLEERFGLVAHRISYPSPVYFLVRGPNVNLTESEEPNAVDIPSFRSEPPQQGVPHQNTFSARHMSMGDLAAWLSHRVKLPVLDKTGIIGSFDIEITGMPRREDGDRIIQAVRDSLGLILEVHQGAAESLIIDRAEKPRQN
jgi:uncharacterized protein (TIGR03435 family)